MMNQPLTNGSQVCITGGGPAGSFAALHLLKGDPIKKWGQRGDALEHPAVLQI